MPLQRRPPLHPDQPDQPDQLRQAPSCPCHAPVTGRPLPDLTGVRLAPIPDPSPPYDDQLPAAPVADPSPYDDRLPWSPVAGPGGHGGISGIRFTAHAPRAGAGREPGQPVPARPRAPRRDARGAVPPGPEAPRPEAPGPGGGEPGGRGPGGRGPDGRGPGGDGPGGGEAGEWPSRFAQVLAETLAGSRPASQIDPWTTERARAHIRRLGPLLAVGQRPRVQRVLTSYPADDVVEVAAIVGFGPRTRALAARLERAGPQPAAPGRPARGARWLCTAIESA